MTELFIVSDLHMFHRNIIVFTREDGSKIRDFDTLEDMHQHIITKWNSVVGKNDIVWNLGDVAFGGSKNLEILNELNGVKHLILGNHDHYKMSEYQKYFDRIEGAKTNGAYLFTHYPVHRSNLFNITCNVHGHTHEKNVMEYLENDLVEFPWYFNASIENINYTPINMDDLKEQINKNKENYKKKVDEKRNMEYIHYS